MTAPFTRTFWFSFDPAFRLPTWLLGIGERTAWVQLTDTTLTARFGRWRVMTPLHNIAAVTVTGPYHYLKTVGPPRLGITDLGLTFASNTRAGVEIAFAEPITGIEPLGVIHHPNLTVTVADPAALAREIEKLKASGES
jgi:hypothetical protein